MYKSCALRTAFALLFWLCSHSFSHSALAESFRVTAVAAPGTPWFDSWVHFEAALDSYPQHQFRPRFYLTGQLGSEESALSQLRRGRVQMGGFSLQGASAVVPELGLLMSPYLFSNHAEVDYVMDHYLLAAFDDLFARRNLILLGWAEVGWTHLYGDRPLLTPDDAQGLKLRSSYALASQLFVQSIGADPITLPFPEIMPSLQTGLINGGESSGILYALTGMAQEAPHLTLTGHAFDSGMILANRNWFSGLESEQQQALRSSLMSVDQFRSSIRATESAVIADAQRNGITLHRPSASQLQEWRSATAANRATLASAIGGDAARINRVLNQGLRAARAAAATAAEATPQSPGPTAAPQ